MQSSIVINVTFIGRRRSAAPTGASFPIEGPADADPVGEQAPVPHAYPLGQHPPLTDSGHVDHPVAHAPVSAVPGAVIPLPVKATIVRLPPLTSVVLTLAGHDVVSQLRPT